MGAQFFLITCDEIASIDEQQQMCIHVYVVDNWMQILLSLPMTQVVGGFSVNKLMKCIMDFLLNEGGMGENENGTKLVAFGANGVSLLHGN